MGRLFSIKNKSRTSHLRSWSERLSDSWILIKDNFKFKLVIAVFVFAYSHMTYAPYSHDNYNCHLHLAVCLSWKQYRTSAPEFISYNQLLRIWKKAKLRYFFLRISIAREITGEAHWSHKNCTVKLLKLFYTQWNCWNIQVCMSIAQ